MMESIFNSINLIKALVKKIEKRKDTYNGRE